MLFTLENCANIKGLLEHSFEDLIQQILRIERMEYLNQHYYCMKQIQYHWQLFITRLLCQNQ